MQFPKYTMWQSWWSFGHTRWHLVLASTRFTARLHCVARPQNDRRQSPSVARPRSVLHYTLVSDDDDDDTRRDNRGIFDKCRVSPRLFHGGRCFKGECAAITGESGPASYTSPLVKSSARAKLPRSKGAFLGGKNPRNCFPDAVTNGVWRFREEISGYDTSTTIRSRRRYISRCWYTRRHVMPPSKGRMSSFYD